VDAPLAVYTDVVDVDPAPGVRLLEAAGFRVRVLRTADPARIATEAPDADALLIGYTRVDAALLAALPRVGIVATQSVGFDMVDVDAALARGVWVANVPAAATEEVAVHALAMTLSLLRGLPSYDRAVRAGRWDAAELELRRPSATTLGVLGLGRIGRRLAALAGTVHGRVIGHDPALDASAWPSGVERVGLDELLAESDVLSLHLPLTDATARIIDAAAIARMRPGAMLVNVSRGGLIDARALVDALDRGRLGGAALDVLEVEPPPPGDPLLRHPRVLLSPHAAYRSEQSAHAYVLEQARNVVEWRERGRPLNPVAEAGRPNGVTA
jgi:phosphoglycerate dehydrogenase-like enzyme